MLYTVQCTMYFVHGTVYTIHFKVHNITHYPVPRYTIQEVGWYSYLVWLIVFHARYSKLLRGTLFKPTIAIVFHDYQIHNC